MKTGTIVVFDQNWVDARLKERHYSDDYSKWLDGHRQDTFEITDESREFPRHFHIKRHRWCFEPSAFFPKNQNIFSNDDFLI